jgi:hypothetical protein
VITADLNFRDASHARFPALCLAWEPYCDLLRTDAKALRYVLWRYSEVLRHLRSEHESLRSARRSRDRAYSEMPEEMSDDEFLLFERTVHGFESHLCLVAKKGREDARLLFAHALENPGLTADVFSDVFSDGEDGGKTE